MTPTYNDACPQCGSPMQTSSTQDDGRGGITTTWRAHEPGSVECLRQQVELLCAAVLPEDCVAVPRVFLEEVVRWLDELVDQLSILRLQGMQMKTGALADRLKGRLEGQNTDVCGWYEPCSIDAARRRVEALREVVEALEAVRIGAEKLLHPTGFMTDRRYVADILAQADRALARLRERLADPEVEGEG